MNISIKTDILNESIRDSFLMESASVPSEVGESRSAGILEEDEFERAVFIAESTVRSAMGRFVFSGCEDSYSNEREMPESFEFEMIGTERRFAGKGVILADLITDAIKEKALSVAFSTTNVELSEGHDNKSIEKIKAIQTLLYHKIPPTL